MAPCLRLRCVVVVRWRLWAVLRVVLSRTWLSVVCVWGRRLSVLVLSLCCVYVERVLA